ncbi:MAG: ATP-binding protein [Desulfobacterales bacterium]
MNPSSPPKRAGGTGLGMPIVKSNVEAYGGHFLLQQSWPRHRVCDLAAGAVIGAVENFQSLRLCRRASMGYLI